MHKKIWLPALLLAVAAAGGDAQEAAKSPAHASASPTQAAGAVDFKAHVLTRSELDGLLARPARLLVIDVRRPDEISSIGGLPVYLNVQVSDLEQSLAWIPKERTIITVSNHAKRAGKVADVLAAKGFKVAGAVGVQTYQQEGGTLTKVPVPARRQADAPAASAH